MNINLEIKEHKKNIPGLRAYTGFKQKGIEIEREKRYYGKTRVGNTRLIKLALDGIFTFSNVPLKFATYIGIILAFPSLVLSIIVVLTNTSNCLLINFIIKDSKVLPFSLP